MPTGRFLALLLLLVAATVAYPLYQAMHTGGIVYYTNGPDETSYLQYDFSRIVQSVTRPGQYLVTLGHDLGLSGGWLNALADAVALLLFGGLTFATFRRLGWDAVRAAQGATGLLVLPLLANASNPAVAALRDRIAGGPLLYWVNTPELFTPALVRTPEPQFSLILLAAAALVAVSRRSFWTAYLVLPFLYPFIAIPAAFVLMACQLHERRVGAWQALLAAFLAVGCAAALYYALFVPPGMKILLVDTRLPLASLSSLIALAAWAALRSSIAPELRFFALALALAPLAASNQQVLSGHLAQPDNFEQYFGCFAVGGVLLLGLIAHARWCTAALALGLLLFLRTSYVTFRMSDQTNAHLPLTPALIAALHEDPAHTVVDNVWMASYLGMTFPRQRSTALAFEQTYRVMADQRVAAYRCLKWRILHDPVHAPQAAALFGWLDDAYTYGSANVWVITIGRKQEFQKLHDVTPRPCDDPAPLRFFHVQ